MRRIVRSFAFILTFLALLQPVSAVSSLPYVNYDTAFVSDVERVEFFDHPDKICFITEEEPINYSINAFAVSKNGLIALGFNTAKYLIIYVYDNDGQFLYGYRFLNNLCNFHLFFEREELSVYFGRSHYIGSFNSEGRCTNFRKVILTQRSRDANDKDSFRPMTGIVGEKKYYVERGWWLTQLSFARFIIEDSEGNRKTVYDATTAHNIRAIVYPTFFIAFAVFVIYQVHRREQRGDEPEENYCKLLNGTKDNFNIEQMNCYNEITDSE